MAVTSLSSPTSRLPVIQELLSPILVSGALQAHALQEGDVASISTKRVHLRIDL